MHFKEISGNDEVLLIPEFMIGEETMVRFIDAGVYHIPVNSKIIVVEGTFDIYDIWDSINNDSHGVCESYIEFLTSMKATGAANWKDLYIMHIDIENPRLVLTNVCPKYLTPDPENPNGYAFRIQFEREIYNTDSIFRCEEPGTIVMAFAIPEVELIG